jgi:hypothetical protein
MKMYPMKLLLPMQLSDHLFFWFINSPRAASSTYLNYNDDGPQWWTMTLVYRGAIPPSCFGGTDGENQPSQSSSSNAVVEGVKPLLISVSVEQDTNGK